jgi:hypothetical protein
MKPASTSYTIAAADTGRSSNQTIKPSELTLWRVIRVNDDWTYDAVSVYTSSTEVDFYGETGYQKLVGTLNKIAAQYTDNKYVVKTRMMGYNGQTETITASITVSNSGKSSTSSSTTAAKEAKGAGDEWYTTDTELVKDVFGTLVANKVGTTTASYYWLASRYYRYSGSTDYSWYGRYVSSGGTDTWWFFFAWNGDLYIYETGFGRAIRPIITLSSVLYASGSGTVNDPYVFR